MKATILRSSCPGIYCDKILESPWRSICHKLCGFVGTKVSHNCVASKHYFDTTESMFLFVLPDEMSIVPSLKLGINLPQSMTILRKLRHHSQMRELVCASHIAFTFAGSAASGEHETNKRDRTLH